MTNIDRNGREVPDDLITHVRPLMEQLTQVICIYLDFLVKKDYEYPQSCILNALMNSLADHFLEWDDTANIDIFVENFRDILNAKKVHKLNKASGND